MEFFHCADSKDKMKQLLEKERDRNLLMSRDAVDILNTCLSTGIETPEKEDEIDMCKGLDDLLADERAEGEARGEARGKIKGKIEALLSLVNDGLLTLETVAERLDMSIEEVKQLATGI